jgi:hypothetical protein
MPDKCEIFKEFFLEKLLNQYFWSENKNNIAAS